MKRKIFDILWFPVNVIQVILLLIITFLAGFFGIFFLIIFRNPRPAVLIVSHYFWSPLFFLICLAQFRVTGREHINKKKHYIYIANHQSQMDIAAVSGSVTVPLFFVAKQELAKVPVVGTYLKAMGMIFVDRKSKDRAMTSMTQAIDLIKKGCDVITFPEGTRSKTGKLQTFRRGSFLIAKQGGIGIVPMAIIGTQSVLPIGSIKIRPGRVRVIIGEPVEPEIFQHLTVEEIAMMFQQKVTALIAKE